MKKKLKRIWQEIRHPEKLKKYGRWLMEKTRPFLPQLMLLMALETALVAVGFASSFLSKSAVDNATAGLAFWPAFGWMIGVNLVTILFTSALGILTTLVNERFSFGIRMQVFDRILEANYLGLSRYHSGDLLTRLTSDVDAISNGISTALPSLVMILVRLGAAFVILYGYSPFLALSALVLGPAGLALSVLLGEKLKTLSAQVKEREAAYRSFMQENMANITVVKTFCQEENSRARLGELRKGLLSAVLRRNRLSVGMNLCIRLLFSLGYFLSFGYCIFGLASGQLTYGTMTLFLTLFSQIQQPIMNLSRLIPQFIGVLASAGRVMEVENIPADWATGETDMPQAVGVRFDRVHFAYRRTPVLQDVSFTGKPGELIGVMGESGAGKTTLIRLALSLMAPDSGQVEFLYDGRAEKASASSRRLISYVPQGNSLMSGTIADNLRYGKGDATEAEMWQALDRAAADFVRSLPQGLHTPLGEKALGLSEGQAQRIAIARALLRKAPVLILDEATSALDAAAEERVLSYLASPERDYAPLCLIITHRRSMIPYFDQLIEIAETGITRTSPKE